ncbi:MAG: sulfatase [Candidatus Hydrogenedentota bacterium]
MAMNRRTFLELTGAGVLAAVASSGTAAANTQRPNIILCMADDQGWGDVAYNGHPVLQTPNLDAMAAAGLRFDRFYGAAPVCSPTRASVMTGRHPNRVGCFQWGHPLRPQEVTLADALKKAGYKTGHFGKWHLGSVRKGSPVNPGTAGFDTWLSAPNYFDNDPILSREGVAEQMHGESSIVTADAAIDFIKEHTGGNGDTPFFAVVWFGSPHRPHRATDQFKEPYAGESDKMQHLFGEITGLDAAVGKLRDTLRELDIADDTLFWYCSDNGGLPESGATGGREHKGEVYEGGLRVPAIIEWPARIREPRQTVTPCVTSDIYPTLLDLTGAAVPNQPTLDGISLAPLIAGGLRTRPAPIGFWDYPVKGVPIPGDEWMKELYDAQQAGKEPEDTFKLRLDAAEIEPLPETTRRGHAAWLDWPWKLHRIEPDKKDVTLELYNLDADPEEKNNLVEQEPERTAAMCKDLESWQAAVIRSYNGADYA